MVARKKSADDKSEKNKIHDHLMRFIGAVEKVTVDVSQQSLCFMHDSLEVKAHAHRLNCTLIFFFFIAL